MSMSFFKCHTKDVCYSPHQLAEPQANFAVTQQTVTRRESHQMAARISFIDMNKILISNKDLVEGGNPDIHNIHIHD
jgi:hypothetical protein